MIQIRSLAVPALLFAAACAAGSSSSPLPEDPDDPGPGRQVSPTEQAAVARGMAILSSDASGAPRLMRAIVPRQSIAGASPERIARDHVAALAPLWIQDARPMALTVNGVQRLRNGATVVRLGQQVQGVIVEQGELRVLTHSDGSLAAVSGTLLPSAGLPVFVSSPRAALEHALDHQYGASRPQPAISDAGERAGWQELTIAAAPQLRVTHARARRELAKLAGKLTAAWAIEVVGDAPPDPLRDSSIPAIAAHRYVVADRDGAILRDTDLVQHDAFVYRAYAETTGNRRPLDGALDSFAPHPTGVPDGSAPGLATAGLVVMDAFNQPLDSWLPANATTTSGNNAEAFADLDGDAVLSPGDIRPEVRAGRVLSYTYDPAAAPLATPSQSKAAVVNAFFVVNWLHDWWYDSGFTEATGNGQRDNYGRGGIAGDPLIIGAQSGALAGSRNNAFMITPADGAPPEMAMFLWTAANAQTVLTTPAGIVRSESFVAGPREFDLTGSVVAADDGVAPGNDGCQPITNDLTGQIALLTFSGVCGSLATINNARAAGAIGVILADGTLDDPRLFAGSAAANIPGLAIGRSAGQALLDALATGPVAVTMQSAQPPERDGDLDNTVVAHEWGHYLHHRLADCGAQQCSGMSEGWGDFNSLLLMLRDGDRRDGSYAIAPYADANGTFDSAYFGIRRFPYSLDRTKNALSFRHISDQAALPTDTPGLPIGPNSEVHNSGEVWTTMLWEVLNVLADEHGVPAARRRMSDYAVSGLLLTPPDATFTEARDAILAAASALDTDDMLLMAAAFAGRGAGSCAVSPSNAAFDNAGVIESGTLAAKLAIGGLSLTDDGISCDHDGYLDPGESGVLRVTVANTGVLAAEAVSITAATASAGVRLGPPIRLGALQPFASAEIAIPVTLLASAPRRTFITIGLHVAADATCDPGGVDVTLTALTGADDIASVSKVDHADTRLTPWTATGDLAAALWGHAFEPAGNESWFARDAGFPTDTQLVSPPLVASTTEPLVIKFMHKYDLESTSGILFDGGVIEVSTDGGATWADVSAFGIDPGYTGPLFIGSNNPLAGRSAFSGTNASFPVRGSAVLDFGTRLAGRSVQLRFRLGTDAAVSATGWDIDDIEATGITNTPFPLLVAEPSTCTARKGPVDDSALIAIHSAPATTLDAFDSAVCIATDTL